MSPSFFWTSWESLGANNPSWKAGQLVKWFFNSQRKRVANAPSLKPKNLFGHFRKIGIKIWFTWIISALRILRRLHKLLFSLIITEAPSDPKPMQFLRSKPWLFRDDRTTSNRSWVVVVFMTGTRSKNCVSTFLLSQSKNHTTMLTGWQISSFIDEKGKLFSLKFLLQF